MRTFALVLALLSGLFYADANADDPLMILAVGDIMMGSTYPKDMLPPEDGAKIFYTVKDEFKGNNIVFGNLEGPLIDRGRPAKCKKDSTRCYEFRTPTRYVRHLKEAGFNAMSIANNHSSDFGLEGIESTINTLGSEGIKTVGGDAVACLDIQGISIAIVGFSSSYSTYSYSILDIKEAMRIISDLKQSHDIVIVSFHGGSEGKSAVHISDKEEFFLGEDRGNVINFSRSAIDAGADMVIGHGPHVLRPLEIYKGKLIAYSLGNFLTYEMFNLSGPNGLSVMLKAKISAETGNFIEGELIPLRLLHGGIPEIDETKEAIKLLQKLTEDRGDSDIIITDSGTFHRKKVELVGEKSDVR